MTAGLYTDPNEAGNKHIKRKGSRKKKKKKTSKTIPWLKKRKKVDPLQNLDFTQPIASKEGTGKTGTLDNGY